MPRLFVPRECTVLCIMCVAPLARPTHSPVFGEDVVGKMLKNLHGANALALSCGGALNSQGGWVIVSNISRVPLLFLFFSSQTVSSTFQSITVAT